MNHKILENEEIDENQLYCHHFEKMKDYIANYIINKEMIINEVSLHVYKIPLT